MGSHSLLLLMAELVALAVAISAIVVMVVGLVVVVLVIVVFVTAVLLLLHVLLLFWLASASRPHMAFWRRRCLAKRRASSRSATICWPTFADNGRWERRSEISGACQ